MNVPYSWILAAAGLYVPVPSVGAVGYPFGLADELTTAVLSRALGLSLIEAVA